MATMAPSAQPLPVRRKPVLNPGIAVRPPVPPFDAQSGHSRTRTTSSGIFPIAPSPTTSTMNSQQYPQQMYSGGLRRTPTSSTSSTTGTPGRTNSGALRRSSSTRSGNSPSSYVALMRKQKATVWCDRAQYDDPRVVAQQRQAKVCNHGSTLAPSPLSDADIRHRCAPLWRSLAGVTTRPFATPQAAPAWPQECAPKSAITVCPRPRCTRPWSRPARVFLCA